MWNTSFLLQAQATSPLKTTQPEAWKTPHIDLRPVWENAVFRSSSGKIVFSVLGRNRQFFTPQILFVRGGAEEEKWNLRCESRTSVDRIILFLLRRPKTDFYHIGRRYINMGVAVLRELRYDNNKRILLITTNSTLYSLVDTFMVTCIPCEFPILVKTLAFLTL